MTYFYKANQYHTFAFTYAIDHLVSHWLQTRALHRFHVAMATSRSYTFFEN